MRKIKTPIYITIVVSISFFIFFVGLGKNLINKNNYEVSNIIITYLVNQGVHKSKLLFSAKYREFTYAKNENDDDSEYWKMLMEASEFEIIEDEIAAYSLKIVENYKYLAQLYGMELKEYYQNVLLLDEEDFYQLCYSEGVYDVEKYLLVGYIAKKEDLAVTEDEISEFCEPNGYVYMEVKADSELKNAISYYILEKKVVEVIK
jgi:FKBP-type peptidyl-prolyl cis-trans isomerase (trigger factor)